MVYILVLPDDPTYHVANLNKTETEEDPRNRAKKSKLNRAKLFQEVGCKSRRIISRKKVTVTLCRNLQLAF